MKRVVAISAVWAVWLILAAVAAVAAPRAALAGPDGKPSPAADARGRAHFQRGQRLSASGDYAGAYREFEAGYAATGRPLFLFNMAEAARADGDTGKARDGYLAFLRADPTSALAATARARLADLGAAPPSSPALPSPPSGSGSRPPTPAAPPAPAMTAPAAPREPVELHPPSSAPVQPPLTSATALPPDRFVTGHDTASRPVWKTWPFWAVVAGSVVAGSVVAYAVTRDGSACGTGCSQVNFR